MLRAAPRFHILMTTDAVGGVWVYATLLARALAAHGCRITLVTMGPRPTPDQLAALRGVGAVDVIETDLALEWMDPEGRDLARAEATLGRIAANAGPDLIHLNGYREATFNWPAPVLVAAHSCVTSWWRACRRADPDEPRWAAYAEKVAEGLNAADVWVAPTAAFRAEVEDLYQPSRRGHVIPNGIDAARAPMAKEPFILASGRVWDEAKNLSMLASLRGDVPWPLRIAGQPGPDVNAGSSDDTTFLGPLSRPDLLARMRRAAIYVSPALYEPFGLGVLEAAMAGCALVLSDIPTFRELWDDAALFVPARDLDALRSTLRRLCEDSALCLRMQAAAQARAQRFSAGATSAAYLELYQDLSAPTSSLPGRSARTEMHT